jgi:hypothetical protein
LTAGACARAIPPHAPISRCAPHRPKTGEEGEDDDEDEDEEESEEESSEEEAPAAGASAAAPAKKPELSREERRAQKKQAKAKPGAADEGENSDGEVLEANANRSGARGMKLSAIADAAPSRRDRYVRPASLTPSTTRSAVAALTRAQGGEGEEGRAGALLEAARAGQDGPGEDGPRAAREDPRRARGRLRATQGRDRGCVLHPLCACALSRLMGAAAKNAEIDAKRKAQASGKRG